VPNSIVQHCQCPSHSHPVRTQFQDFVAPGMAAEDPTRPIWPASPSAGWADGVDRLWGHPLPGRRLRILEREPLHTTPVGTGCNCTEQAEAFYYGMPIAAVLGPQVADAVACCKLCEATPGCVVANFAKQRGCQLVAPPFSPTSRLRSVALFPPSSISLPMPIPAVAVAEQHGPCERDTLPQL
jgi:hypothetical protein